MSKGDYRLARVVSAAEDKSGHVRTVKVALRPRNILERSLPYKVKQPMIMTLAVQRLVVILPAEEQEEQIQRQAEEEERLRVAGLPPIKEMILQGRSKEKVLSTDIEKAGQTGTGDEEEEGQGSPGGDMEGHPVGEADLYLEKGNGLDIQE